MPKRSPLFLYEEIMLLALRDKEGTVATQYIGPVIAGAVLAELLFGGRVKVSADRKQIVELSSTAPMGDPVIDECLTTIAASSSRRGLKGWVEKLARFKLSQKVALQLVERGIVRAEERKVLLIFSRQVYPEISPVPERAIVKRLQSAIFTEMANVTPRTAVLVALADGAGLLARTFGKREVKLRKKRIAAIVAGSVAGKATKDVIAAQQAAVMAAAIMPAVIVTAVHN